MNLKLKPTLAILDTDNYENSVHLLLESMIKFTFIKISFKGNI